MKGVSTRSFGTVIGYVIPGFVAVWGMRPLSSTVDAWLSRPAGPGAAVGGVLYVTLASLGAGLAASAVRWVSIDRLHHLTGVPEPKWDFSGFRGRVRAFEALVENHYRHYQFYATTLISIVFAYFTWRTAGGGQSRSFGLIDCGVGFLGAVFFAASRDTLRKYYSRGSQLLASPANRRKGIVMVNGYGHDEKKTASKRSKRSASKRQQAPKKRPEAPSRKAAAAG